MRVTSNRLEWMLIGTSVLAMTVAWLFTYWSVVEDRALTHSTSGKVIDSLAIILEEHMSVTLRDARNAVYSAAVLIENAGGFSGFTGEDSLHRELNRELNDDGSTARLIVADGSGRVIASSSEYPLPEISVAKHQTFAWHASHPAARGFHLGVPYKSAIGGRMVIPYSRAVFDGSGGVAGVVVAELRAEYLAGLYASLTGGIHASVVVFNHDGIILMRVPYLESILGRSATSPANFKQMLETSGSTEFTSEWDGKTRYYSHRVMQRDPILIAVGVDKDNVMAPSAARTQHRVAVMGAATLVFLALVWLLAAGLRRLARSEVRLRDSETRLKLANQAANIGLWDWEIAASRVYFSPEWKSQLGYRDDEIDARLSEWETRLHPEDKQRALARFQSCVKDPRLEYATEFRLRHKNGSYRWIYARGEFLRDAEGEPQRMLGCHIDITERKRAEEALLQSYSRSQELSRRLVAVEETERHNISRELHDRVGQNLTALNLNLEIMRNQLPENPPQAVRARLDDAHTLLKQTVDQVRNVMADLRPAALDDYGLLAALRTYAKPFAERLGIPVLVHGCALDPRPPIAVEIVLFRIAQEALNNIAKHARAGRIDIRLAEADGRITLGIADDGVGFDAGQPPQNVPGYGVITMRERAETIGAELHIETAPGKGTRIMVELAEAGTCA